MRKDHLYAFCICLIVAADLCESPQRAWYWLSYMHVGLTRSSSTKHACCPGTQHQQACDEHETVLRCCKCELADTAACNWQTQSINTTLLPDSHRQ